MRPDLEDAYRRFYRACAEGNLRALKEVAPLIGDIECPNERGWTGLIMAAYGEHLDIIAELIARGANVNGCNAKGTSVLMYAKGSASRSGRIDVLRFLLDSGADIEATDRAGISLLEYARREGNPKIIDFLESHRRTSS